MASADPRLIALIAALPDDADWLVALRALDLLEKIARANPALVEPYETIFIGPVADAEQWEMHLQVVRALPLFRWTGTARARVLKILRRDLEHPQKFVRAWALDALAQFAESDARLLPDVQRGLAAFDDSGSNAIVARARRIRERLNL